MLLKNTIYFLAILVFDEASFCYNYLKFLCHYLSIKLYLDNDTLKTRIKRV